jgi:hypothetical protein
MEGQSVDVQGDKERGAKRGPRNTPARSCSALVSRLCIASSPTVLKGTLAASTRRAIRSDSPEKQPERRRQCNSDLALLLENAVAEVTPIWKMKRRHVRRAVVQAILAVVLILSRGLESERFASLIKVAEVGLWHVATYR